MGGICGAESRQAGVPNHFDVLESRVVQGEVAGDGVDLILECLAAAAALAASLGLKHEVEIVGAHAHDFWSMPTSVDFRVSRTKGLDHHTCSYS